MSTSKCHATSSSTCHATSSKRWTMVDCWSPGFNEICKQVGCEGILSMINHWWSGVDELRGKKWFSKRNGWWLMSNY